MIVTGNVSATADLHIDGRVEGDVNCGSLAQGSESQIFGGVTAETARLAGSIEGTVRVKTLTIERSAKITGDVEYENITIENGGHIDGRLMHMSTVDVSSGPRVVSSNDLAVRVGERASRLKGLPGARRHARRVSPGGDAPFRLPGRPSPRLHALDLVQVRLHDRGVARSPGLDGGDLAIGGIALDRAQRLLVRGDLLALVGDVEIRAGRVPEHFQAGGLFVGQCRIGRDLGYRPWRRPP